ncbi:MAG: rhodanese-like domain-containing protein [Chitinophagaceae bacterium]
MRYLSLIISIAITINCSAQFKADNVKYKTVFPEELCKTLQENPGYVLLDVRSQGEFDDTLSSSPGLNIGHIKDALHINIQELSQRWKELLPYKDKPLFIYCSHSQRSRRASRMLADSGFTKLFNVNGGLTDFYIEGNVNNPCSSYKIVSNLKYKIISPAQLTEDTRKGKDYYILDVRSDSSFKGISTSAEARTFGRLDNASNIPFEKLMSMNAFVFPDKPILLVDEYGSESAKAAAMLDAKGVKNISILINGMEEWLDYVLENGVKQPIKWTQKISFNLITGKAFDKLMADKKDITLIDVRDTDEFNNQSKNYWQNIGNIQGAVNIPFGSLTNSDKLPKEKNRPIIVYGFNNGDAIYKAAEELLREGYSNVSVLRGGIWNLRWSSHNIKDKGQLNKWVVNVPEENL